LDILLFVLFVSYVSYLLSFDIGISFLCCFCNWPSDSWLDT